MLINWAASRHVYIVCGKTDLRKGIDGLALIVEENYGLQLDNNSLFLFCGSRTDRFKGLYWDGEGFILLYKRFENGNLRWPRHRNDAVSLTPYQSSNYYKASLRCLLSASNRQSKEQFISQKWVFIAFFFWYAYRNQKRR